MSRSFLLVPVAGPVVAALLVAGLPGIARAHAILTASTPAPGGVLAAGAQTLDLQYNSKIDHKRSRLTLTGPDNKPVVLAIASSSAVNALDTEVTLAPGAYTLRWQALALDGHITRGDVPFTVK